MTGRLALRGLRVVVLVHAALVLAQAAFAGRWLAGDAAGLRAHETNAGLIELVALVQLGLAVALWRPGRGPGWPALASLALLLAEGFQIGMGYEGRLALHVPLGWPSSASPWPWPWAPGGWAGRPAREWSAGPTPDQTVTTTLPLAWPSSR